LKSFFDTNVLVYATDRDPRMARLAVERLRAGGVISAQVLNEMVAVLRGKLKQPWDVVERALAAVDALGLDVVAVTPEAQRMAVRLSRDNDIHIYDATIIASALEAGCDTLWTDDLTDGQRFGGLMVRNPFKG
jgi:predicted nucleic acid-binding protein